MYIWFADIIKKNSTKVINSILLVGNFSFYLEAVHLFHLWLESLRDLLVLLEPFYSFELDGLDHDVVHWAAPARNIIHRNAAGLRESSLEHSRYVGLAFVHFEMKVEKLKIFNKKFPIQLNCNVRHNNCFWSSFFLI